MTEQTEEEKQEGYGRCIEKMQRGAAEWVRQHPHAELRFNPFEAELARENNLPYEPGDKIAVIADLKSVIPRWAGNADARAFLQAMEDASEGQATYLQARAIVDLAAERTLEHSSGKMEPGGQWACSNESCKEVLEGFTYLDGREPEQPQPGTLNVCGHCGATQRVADDGQHFEELTAAELRKLPKSLRMHLLKLKGAVLDRVAREKRKS